LKQHSVQEAYLKKFEDKGRIWAHDKVGVKPSHIPAKKCTMEIDFQNYELESLQNNSIEKPAISVIRSLNSGDELREDQALKLFAWSELHLIRNQNFRTKSEINYNQQYDSLLDAERKFSLYYNCVSVYNCNEHEFFITSDNPILELCFGGIMIRMFVISPKVLVMMSPREGFPTTEISFTEMVNSAIYANRYKYIFSHKCKLPLDLFEENAKRYSLFGTMTSQKIRLVSENP
jgi:hypothetical protein